MSVTNISRKADILSEYEETSWLPTEDDLPYDDGEPMETSRHRDQMNLLIDSLKAYWEDRKKYYVGGNMFLHYKVGQTKKFRGPDFFLVMDADNRERKSWVVWQERGRFPDLIIELLSDTTRKIDKGLKKDLYEQVFGTSEYYLYDPHSYEFEGYRLAGNCYIPVLPDKDRKIYSRVTGLYLGVKDDWLRWITDDGQVVPSNEELFRREKARAEQEKARAEQEKARAEQEKARAEQEKARAEQAEKRFFRSAREMLASGMDPAAVMRYTGLSADEIGALSERG